MNDIVERARDAEIERLRAAVVGADREIKASHADADRLRAERDGLLTGSGKLLAEIERLKAALREIADRPRASSSSIARAALEGK